VRKVYRKVGMFLVVVAVVAVMAVVFWYGFERVTRLGKRNFRCR